LLVLSVLAALAAGCTFAVGSVLQQSAAREAPRDEALSLRLLVGLAHRRRWLAGISCDAGSFGLQALALAFGPIALVQPLLVTGVLFAVPLAMRYRHRRLHAREWLATAAVAAGLAAFLAAARPTAGRPQAPLGDWIAVLVVLVVVGSVAVAVGRTRRGPARASLFSVAAGCGFGLLAALTKTSTWLLGQGAERFFTSWQPYAMAVVAVGSAVVQQSAFQAGPLPTSVPVMDAVEPTVAVLIGMFAFHEHLARSLPAVLLEALGVVVLLTGIVVLDRSPVILRMQRAGDQRALASSTGPEAGGRAHAR
jgi:drug/metabolite transporter (DMT)-like permease